MKVCPRYSDHYNISKMVDLITEAMFSFPKCFVTKVSDTNSCKIYNAINCQEKEELKDLSYEKLLKYAQGRTDII